VLVTVVQVGQVSVHVRDGLMHMQMGVPHRSRDTGVRVVVVPIVVTVTVDVLHRWMDVRMAMPIEEQQHHAGDENGRGAEVNHAERLVQDRRGQARPDERGRREGDLRSRRSEVLR
jgi:hypothetical protein